MLACLFVCFFFSSFFFPGWVLVVKVLKYKNGTIRKEGGKNEEKKGGNNLVFVGYQISEVIRSDLCKTLEKGEWELFFHFCLFFV